MYRLRTAEPIINLTLTIMEIIYQRANCEENGHIVYLGCCYKFRYNLEMSILADASLMSELERLNQERLEEVRGSWPAKIEMIDGFIYTTTFFPLYAYRRSYDNQEITLGYIEHTVY